MTFDAIRQRLKLFVRRRPFIYRVVRILKYGPYLGIESAAARNELLAQGSRRKLRMLNLGGGGRTRAGAINMDLDADSLPDVVGDAFSAPFRRETFDIVFCENVIEHVKTPQQLLASIRDLLTPSGKLYMEYPLLQPRHHEYDYMRWTVEGFNRSALEAGFEIERFDVYLGPSYVLFWVLTDSFSLLFGPMRGAARYVFRWLFCPILILDVIFLRVPGILNVAAGIWVILRKPQTGSGRT